MAKQDLLDWLLTKTPPLKGTDSQTPAYELPNLNDYDAFNAITTAEEAEAVLRSKCPPLTEADVIEGLAKYNL
jgi:hypothetical protein